MTFPLDKQAHALGGAVIFYTLAAFGAWDATGLFVVAAAAGFKEIYDAHYPDDHTSDLYDFFATVFGGMAALAVMQIARLLA